MTDRREDARSSDTATPTGRPGVEPAEPLEELLARALPGVEPLPREEPQRVLVRRRAGRPRPGVAENTRSPFTLDHYDEIVSALAPGADPRLLDRLRCGRIAPEAELDLHGHSVAAATAALEAFLSRTAAEGRSCVLIIHGRGLRSPAGPVLKDAVVAALTTSPLDRRIVALATAPREHGGPGALLVQLRRRSGRGLL